MKWSKPLVGLAACCALVACDTSDETTPKTSETPSREAQARESAPMKSETMGETILEIMASPHRSDTNRERDQYRNPEETLFFFELKPEHTVMEINPGGGWYMEIIAPFVRDKGHYIAATPDPSLDGMPGYVERQATSIQARIDDQKNIYGDAEMRLYNPAAPELGEPESVDRVLTFRNVHNWIGAEQAQGMFDAFARVLKPGGMLGVVQHRAEDGSVAEKTTGTGYVSEATVIKLAEEAGLELDGRSNLNANPKDTRDYEQGVWTLPPTLRLGEQNREEYLSIGESDRMTLRFIKPAKPAEE